MKNKFSILLLILITFLLVICNFIWLKIDTRPPHWDFAVHLSSILTYFNYFDHKEISNLITHYSYYPPLSYYLTALTYRFFRINEDIAVLSLTPYLIILIFSTYKIGQTLKNNKLGILMVISLIGMPFLMSQTREYQLDFPLTAMVALNIYLFLKTDIFRNRKFSIIFGCTSGLAMLTKWTYLPFFVGIIIVSFIFDDKKNYLTKLKNIAILFLIILAISGPWYINNLSHIKASFNKNITITMNEHAPSILSKESLLWYINSLYIDHLRFPLSTLTIIGLIYLIKNWRKSKKIIQFLFISLFYLLVMTMYRYKDARFIEPLTPILVLLICFWIIEIKNFLFRTTLIILVICLSIFNYYSSTFGLIRLPYVLETKLFNRDVLWYKQYGYIFGPPRNEKWHLKEIIREVGSSSKKALFILSEDKMFLNIFNVRYYGRLYTKYLFIDAIIENGKCKNLVYDYDFIAINDNLDGRQILACKLILKDYYEKNKYLLPDNSVVIIFKKLDSFNKLLN
jgi:4-amino-4-deoxy-L-arabinose transferase-like glycosyltransferase